MLLSNKLVHPDNKPVVSDATVPRCSSKYMFLKASQYSQENTLLESLFSKLSGLQFLIKFLINVY